MSFMDLVPTRPRELAGSQPARHDWHRAREVPATAIPKAKDRKRTGTAISVLAHLLLLLFLIADPPLHTDPNLVELKLGAGGPGPAGGGGGGNNGSGGVRYIKVVPPPKPVPPPVVPPQIVEPPKLPDPVVPEIELPKLAVEAKVEVKVQSPIVGIGGGTGNDGTRGNGPGSGGGVGSGIGTGNGSGVGPGTGGGNTGIHEPTTSELLIPPLPTPAGLKGVKILVIFDVDSTGRVLSFSFTPTKDRSYNKKLDDLFKGYKFRPGTTLQGVPVRAKAQITMTL